VQLELVAEINHPIIIEIIYKKRDAIASLFLWNDVPSPS